MDRAQRYYSSLIPFLVTGLALWTRCEAEIPCPPPLAPEDAEQVWKANTTAEQRKLYEAVLEGHSAEAVAEIPRVKNINFYTRQFVPILSLAVEKKATDVVKSLLLAGADPNTSDCQGWPALMYLEMADTLPAGDANVVIANLLVAHGAAIKNKAASPWRAQLFSIAAGQGDKAIVRWLIDQGISPDEQFGASTPLISAVKADQLATTKMLLDAGANPDGGGAQTPTALMTAVEVGDPELVRALLQHGANVNERRVGGSAMSEALARRQGPSHSEKAQKERDESIVDILRGAGATQ